MDGKEISRALRLRLTQAKESGITQLPISTIEQQIDIAEQHATECYDYKKMEHESQIEMLRSVLNAGASTLKSAMVLNGGGAVALLAFIAKVKESGIAADINAIVLALMTFSVGAMLAGLGNATTYFTQSAYHKRPEGLFGHIMNTISLFIVGGSFGCFIVAIFKAASAIN